MPMCLQALVGFTAADVEPSLLTKANWAAVPATLPVISLAFVYQNVVPVITTQLEVCGWDFHR